MMVPLVVPLAPLKYLQSQEAARPDLAEWYSEMADLYQRKLWHQLTVKLEQFIAHAQVAVQASLA